MTQTAIQKALGLATQANVFRQLKQARAAERTTGTLTGTLIGRDQLTGEDIFRTSTGGEVRAMSNTTSGLPRGSTLQLPRSDQSDRLHYDRPPTAASDQVLPIAGGSEGGGSGNAAAAALVEQLDVVLPEPESGTLLLVQHQAYPVRINALFVGGGMSAATIPSVGSTVATGGQISLNVLSVTSGQGNASIVLQRVSA